MSCRFGEAVRGLWTIARGAGATSFPETLTGVTVSGNMHRMSGPTPENSAATNRVRQHRATSGMIRVEVEVPTPEDALAVRRFAQARRRAKETPPPPPAGMSPASTASARGNLAAVTVDMDAVRQGIVLLFGQALAQATDPDMLARGRRVALNFADAVAQRCRDAVFSGDGGRQ